MRGLPAVREFLKILHRYNPAYAGTTRVSERAVYLPTIQPRVCGDYPATAQTRHTGCDTTPRMRGLLKRPGSGPAARRYNPAYAGTTWAQQYRGVHIEIQPRVCGDYNCNVDDCSHHVDTTPRMRGLRYKLLSRQVTNGYNPAYAGTTSFSPRRVSYSAIQPRVCGDYTAHERLGRAWNDTTPRMRGLQ